MEEIYKDAFAETDAIISIIPREFSDKIPTNIKKVISENKTPDYVVDIHSEENLLKETKAILSLIYRKYLRNISLEEDESFFEGVEEPILEEKVQLQPYKKYNFFDIVTSFLKKILLKIDR